MQDAVLELFLELEAKEEQFDAPFLYGSAKEGFARVNLDDDGMDMQPLFQAIVQSVPPPKVEESNEFRMLVSNVDWSDYVGRIGVGKVLSGSVKVGDPVWRLKDGLETGTGKGFQGLRIFRLGYQRCRRGGGGNIVGIAGFEELDIERLCPVRKSPRPCPCGNRSSHRDDVLFR